MVRLNGVAAPGAVVVDGGAENVREPREPELELPPTRASASEAAIATGSANERTTATALIMPRARWVNFIEFSSNSRHGNVP